MNNVKYSHYVWVHIFTVLSLVVVPLTSGRVIGPVAISLAGAWVVSDESVATPAPVGGGAVQGGARDVNKAILGRLQVSPTVNNYRG